MKKSLYKIMRVIEFILSLIGITVVISFLDDDIPKIKYQIEDWYGRKKEQDRPVDKEV